MCMCACTILYVLYCNSDQHMSSYIFQSMYTLVYITELRNAIAHHTHYYISQLSDIHKSIHISKYVYSCVYH